MRNTTCGDPSDKQRLRCYLLLLVLCTVWLPLIHCSAVPDSATPAHSPVVFHSLAESGSGSESPSNHSACKPEGESQITPGDGQFYLYVFLTLGCVIIGGLMSGLQVGLFSLDPLRLAMLLEDETASQADKARARRLVPVLERHHLLLVTLLVCNAAAMEAMPIFLDQLVPSYVAIILSVTFVLFFGEVIPQALCVKSPLTIGAFLIPFVRFLMFIFYPISKPVAMILDYVLGVEGGNHFLLQRSELNALVDLHAAESGGHLHDDTVLIMKGAMAISEKRARDIMTPIQDVYMLEVHRHLDLDVMTEIFKSGYSRIPCYDEERKQDGIIGLLIVKDLLLLDPQDAIPISTILNLYGRPVTKVFDDVQLADLLQQFRSGRSHMAVVQQVNSDGPGDPFYVNVGIVTLEDVIECILQSKIEDETDIEDTMASKTRFNLVTRYARRKLGSNLAPQELSAVYFHLTGVVDVFKTGHRILSELGLKKLIYESPAIEIKVNTPGHVDLALEASLAATGQSEDNSEIMAMDIMSGGRSVYRRGEPNDYFVLILDGCVDIRAGVDEFQSEGRRWSVLGTICLKLAEQRLSNQLAHIERYYQQQGTSNINVANLLHDKNITLAQLLQQTGYNIVHDHPYVYIPDFTAVVKQTSRILRISRHAYMREIMREMNIWTPGDEAREATLRSQVDPTNRSPTHPHLISGTYDYLTSIHSMPSPLHNSKHENAVKEREREAKMAEEHEEGVKQDITTSHVEMITHAPKHDALEVIEGQSSHAQAHDEEKHALLSTTVPQSLSLQARVPHTKPHPNRSHSPSRPVFASPLLAHASQSQAQPSSEAIHIDIHDQNGTSAPTGAPGIQYVSRDPISVTSMDAMASQRTSSRARRRSNPSIDDDMNTDNNMPIFH